MAIDWSAARKKAEELDKDLERYAHKPSNTGREEASGTGQSIQVKTRTNKSAPPAALPESKGKGILLPKTGVDLRLPGQRAEAEEKLDAVKQEQRILAARENVARRSGGFTLEDAKTYEAEKGPLRQRAQGLQTDIDRIDYIREYERIRRGDNFGGQFLASYDMGRMGQDEANAWSEYLANPTESNRAYAEAVSATRGHYAQRNAAALDEDAALPIISQSFAGYLPQLIDENIAGAKGAALGAGTGTVIPGIGTAVGAKVGYTAGRSAYGYQTMQGMAFKALLDAGVDEETARAAANDEALIGSLMEGGDAAIDMLTLGLGKGLKALLKKPVQEAAGSAGRKIASALGKYGINIASEGAQEWVQEGISLANQNRSGTGTLNLVGETAGQIGRALSGQDPDALSQMNAAGIEGMKIAALMSGAAAGRNAVVNSIQNGRPRSQARQQNNAATMMLPTSEQSPDGRIYLPGSPVYQRSAVDNPAGAGYDGGTQNIRTGGVNDGGGEAATPELQGVYATDVRGGSQRTYTGGEGTYPQIDGRENRETAEWADGGVTHERRQASDLGTGRGGTIRLQAEEAGIHGGRDGQIPETAGAVYRGESGAAGQARIGEWARGHIVENPSSPAVNRALGQAKAYTPDAVVVEDSVIKAHRPNTLGLTSDGVIYLSDAIPEELSAVVPNHEIIHALKQRGNEAYRSFVDTVGERIAYTGDPTGVLDVVIESRYPGKTLFDLSMEELDTVYDELNALVWGYYKADPENARAQFAGVFQDYDAYIQELDTIMEGARQPVENQTGVGPTQAQGPESSVGAARANFTGDTERGFSKNLATDRARHPDIQEDFQLDPEKYFRLSNKKTLQKAQDIFSTGLDNARSTVEQALGRAQEGRKLAPEIVPLSKMVADALAAQGDMNGARRILAGVAAELTSAGQLGQAAKILRDADPKTTIESVERIVDNLNDALGGKNKIVVDQSLIDEYDRQTDNAGRADVLDQIYDSVASQIPSTPLDKFNALRYTNMLGNIKTQVKNVGGNLIMKGVRAGRVKVQAAIEALAQKRGMDFERTTSFTRDRAIYKQAKKEFDAAQAEIMGEQKYSYNGKSIPAAIHNRRTIFKNNGTWGTDPHSPAYLLRKGTDFLWKLPEGYRRLTNWAMEKGDIVFAKSAYADALSRYLKANGVTVEQYKSGDVDYELLERAQAYAVREAQEATFRDSNAFSDMIASIGFRKADTLPKKVVNTALQGSLPFRRTPANVTVRAVEYSPLGVIDTAVKGVSKARGNESITSAEVIRSMSKTLTGSGLFAVGAVLGAAGFLSGLGSSDEEEKRLDEQSGRQNYAIYLPDWLTELVGLPKGFNFTLDWASPASVPLFMGAELGTAWEKNGFQWKDFWAAMGSSSNVLLNMSMLQGIDDQLSNISYSEYPLVDLTLNSLTDFINAGLTNTFAGQIERAFEDKRMTTYTDKNLELPTGWQYEIGRASARTPGWDYQQIPYIDAWGREESAGPMLTRAFNQFLNPSYTSSNTETPVIRESRRLYELTGESGVVAERPEKEITVDGEKIFLNAGQYVQYATIQGRTQNEILSEILDSSAYQNLDTQKRVAVFEDAYKYADAVGKASVSNFKPKGWIADLMDGGLPPEDYILFRAATVDIEGDKDENGKTIPGSKKKKVLNVIDQMNVSDEVKDKYYYAAGYAEDTISDAPWHGWGWW